MWTIVDPNTHYMMVTGGTLYRFSDERGHAMCFVPYVQNHDRASLYRGTTCGGVSRLGAN